MTTTEPATERRHRPDATDAGLSPRASRSREKLLRAATELLVEAGPRGVTVDAVAETSGVAKSTLYRHYSTRDELLIDVVRCNIPDLPEPDETADFEVALHHYVQHAAATLSDPEWSRIIPAMMSLRTTMPELADAVEHDRSVKSAKLQTVIDKGVAERVLPPGLDVRAVANLLVGPLVFCALTGDTDTIADLATYAAERFIASYASTT